MNRLRRVVGIRQGGRVERCHTIPHSGSYNNAAHQWGVTMLLWELFPSDFERLAIFTLTHDVPEAWVGDIPAPALWGQPTVKETIQRREDALLNRLHLPSMSALDAEDVEKIAACDRLELYIWCLEEWYRGNAYADDCREALVELFTERPLPDAAHALYQELRDNPRAVLGRQRGVIREIVEKEA